MRFAPEWLDLRGSRALGGGFFNEARTCERVYRAYATITTTTAAANEAAAAGDARLESRRPGYPNMTRPDAAGSLPLGVEPLIYSYLVSSTEAGCYFQGRIRILARDFSPHRDRSRSSISIVYGYRR